MSPRAASRLESIGFTRVHDYPAGKLDWLAYGLPIGGSAAGEPTIGALARREVPTCGLRERLADLGPRLTDEWTWCAVVDESGVLLGRVVRRQLVESSALTAGEAMRSGPSTNPPSMPAFEMVEAMTRGEFRRAFVTDSDGRLLGVVVKRDLEAALAG